MLENIMNTLPSDSGPQNIKDLFGTEDELIPYELAERDKYIEAGIKECRKLLGKQKSSTMYYFYEKSIDAFEECKNFYTLSDFETRIQELHTEERNMISQSIKDPKSREELGLVGPPQEPDPDVVWGLKGLHTQIHFVYKKLVDHRTILSYLSSKAPDNTLF